MGFVLFDLSFKGLSESILITRQQQSGQKLWAITYDHFFREVGPLFFRPARPTRKLTYRKNFCNLVIFNQGSMKLSTHVFSEVLHGTIPIFFLLNQQKEHLTEIIQNAENLTFGSVTANTAPAYPILPLPTRYCPCPPTPSRTPILFRFFCIISG